MALNPEFVGRTYPPGPAYLVGRETVREFATAIGEDHAVFHDPEAAAALGYAGVVAPPTFAVIIAMQASGVVVHDPDLGLDYTRVVHGEQRFDYSRPIVAGDELVVSVTIESIRTVAGNDMITTRSDIATVSGEHVVTTTSLLVSRGPEEE